MGDEHSQYELDYQAEYREFRCHPKGIPESGICQDFYEIIQENKFSLVRFRQIITVKA